MMDETAATQLYHYYFRDIKKPIIIPAPDKIAARIALRQNLQNLPAAYKESNIVSETVATPVSGVTTLAKDGKVFVWQKNRWVPQTAQNHSK